jgi:hypothetical protein
LPSLPLARGQNIDGAAERLQNLQDLPNLGRWLAGFEIDNEAKTDASNSGKLILPQVLLLACAAYSISDLFCHLHFPDRENSKISGVLSRRISRSGKLTATDVFHP